MADDPKLIWSQFRNSNFLFIYQSFLFLLMRGYCSDIMTSCFIFGCVDTWNKKSPLKCLQAFLKGSCLVIRWIPPTPSSSLCFLLFVTMLSQRFRNKSWWMVWRGSGCCTESLLLWAELSNSVSTHLRFCTVSLLHSFFCYSLLFFIIHFSHPFSTYSFSFKWLNYCRDFAFSFHILN